MSGGPFGEASDWEAEERESSWGDGRVLRLGCRNFLLGGREGPSFVLWGGRAWRFSSVGMMDASESGSLAFALELKEPGFTAARREAALLSKESDSKENRKLRWI